jgi:hypothetical protein
MIDEFLVSDDLAWTFREIDQNIERPGARGSVTPLRRSTLWPLESSNGPNRKFPRTPLLDMICLLHFGRDGSS